ncbi:MAG: hypothetical protein ABIH76_04960 [Candidatus Bathyarchaeota archaeon]
MPIPQVLVSKFFELTLNRDFAEAERFLTQAREQGTSSDWSKGYILALEGFLIAYRGKNDGTTFINRVELDKENVSKLEEDFRNRARNPVELEYDKGFFAAWSDLMRFVKKNELWGINRSKAKKEDSPPETPEA